MTRSVRAAIMPPMIGDRHASATAVPGPVALLVGVFLLGLGLATRDLVGPPLLAGFLIYMLLPWRREPWVLRLLGILLVVVVLWTVRRFGSLLLILGVSFFLAYVLDPAVDRLSRGRLSRSLAILILLVPAMALLGLAAALVLPPLLHELGQLVSAVPEYAGRIEDKVQEVVRSSQLRPLAERYEEFIPRLLATAQKIVTGALGRLVDVSRAVGTGLAATLLVPIVTFYLLRDYDRVRAQAEELVPRRYHPWLSETAREMDRLLGRWLRGSAIVALIVAAATGLGLVVLGVPYALLLAALAGLLNFVPVVGFWISLLAAALTALAASGWPALLQVTGLYLVLNVVEGQVLSPRIVGDAVGLHPVVMLAALTVFADLFGLPGALLAVPLAILLMILLRQIRHLYMASDLYGSDEGSGSPS